MSSVVLVVDDDPISVHLIQLILERSGYGVVVAYNATAGLELAAEALPNAVIIDDMLPGMSGGEMCRRLKNDPNLQDIPVVLISAGMRVQDASYVKKSGADYALIKPILPKDLLRALDIVFGRLA
ncbi:MAG: response regulator [Chloroflexi bacterium]|nr:response regulator [Chloroflexota bacterium]